MTQNRKLLPALVIALLSAAIYTAPASARTPEGKPWKKQVVRLINVKEKEDTVKHHLKDVSHNKSLAELMINAIYDGKLAAYSNGDDEYFTTKLTPARVKEMLTPRPDTIMVTDPVTGSELMKVVTRDLDYDMLTKFRVLEDWTFDPNTGNTDVKILGIAPIKLVYGEDGAYRGSMAIFWIKYADALPILERYDRYHPSNTFSNRIWNDYFSATPYRETDD
jgi:Gliding motility associated protein GldN